MALWISASKSVNALSCEMNNSPIDCSKLTEYECEEVQHKRDSENLNRNLQCSEEVVAAATAAAGGAGTGGGGDSGDSSSEGDGKGSGTANTNNESEVSDETQTNEPITVENEGVEEETPQSARSKEKGMRWGKGDLCQDFKSAYEKAKDEKTRQLILKQKASIGC